jgi:hypothetical protein
MPAGAFFNGNAYATAETLLAIGREKVRGTVSDGSAGGIWQIPAMAPKYKPDLMLIPVDTLQGSMVQTYSYVTGIRYDGHGWNAPPFLNSFPLMLQMELGSPDGYVTAIANTALTAQAAAGATTLSITAASNVPTGSWITFNTASNQAAGTVESHYVLTGGASVSSITLAEPLVNTQLSGATVSGLYKHTFVLQNVSSTYVSTTSAALSTFTGSATLTVNSTTGFPTAGAIQVVVPGVGSALLTYTGTSATTFTGCNWLSSQSTGVTGSTTLPVGVSTNPNVTLIGAQPPSATLWDFDGEQWRTITAAQLDELSLKGNGTSLVDYTCTWFGNPANDYAAPATLATNYLPELLQSPAPWSFYFQLGGTVGTPGGGVYSPTVTDWTISFKRNVKPIPALTGQQNYFQYFAGPIIPTVKFTFIEQPGSPQLNAFLNGTTTPVEVSVFDQLNGAVLNIRAEAMEYTTGEIDRSKEWVEVVVDGTLLPTTYNSAAGVGNPPAIPYTNTGPYVGPCVCTVANAVSGAYDTDT